jgi:hypothetical protein
MLATSRNPKRGQEMVLRNAKVSGDSENDASPQIYSRSFPLLHPQGKFWRESHTYDATLGTIFRNVGHAGSYSVHGFIPTR